MIIIYTDKPLISRHIAPLIKAQYPDKEIVFIHVLYFKNIKHQYPKQLKLEDYPCTLTPEFKLADWDEWMPLKLTANDTVESTTISSKDLLNAEKIIYVGEPDSHSAYLFSIFIEKVLNLSVEIIRLDSLFINSLDIPSLTKSIEETENFYTRYWQYIESGKIIDYFNYQFNINSLVIFGIVLSKMGINTNKHFMSKYMIQLLYYFKTLEEPISDAQLLSNMNSWRGTGKYKNTKANFGSITSRWKLIENLRELNFISHEDNKNSLSEKGEVFLSYLHKDCYDPDLPFRLDAWANKSCPEVFQKIDIYIKTYFGKQKRKFNKILEKTI